MNTVKWHNNWKEGRNRDPGEAGAQEHGADKPPGPGKLLSGQSCRTGFGCNDLQIMAVTCSCHPAFPCALRQLNHPFRGNKHFPFLWAMQRKGTISSSKELSCIISNKFPETVQWGRNRWEKQNRLSAEFLGTATSPSLVFQLFPYIFITSIRQRPLERTWRSFRKPGYQNQRKTAMIYFLADIIYAR